MLVVNKADLAGADRLVADLRGMLQLAEERVWRTPILRTVATEGTGVAELIDAVAEHRAFLECSGRIEKQPGAHAGRTPGFT